MTTTTLKTERAALDFIRTSGFAKDESDRNSTWTNTQGDEAHIHRTPDKSGWTVTVRSAAEVAEFEREMAIASLIYNFTSEVSRGREEVSSAIERAIRELGRVKDRFDREPFENQTPADELRHALSNAAGEFTNMARFLTEAAVRAEAAAKAQENLVRSAGFLVPMMGRVRESLADRLAECKVEIK